MSRTRWIRRAFRFVLLAVVASQLGCGVTGYFRDDAQNGFSPNSKRAAQITEFRRGLYPFAGGPILDQNVYVYLWDAAHPDKWRRVVVDLFGPYEAAVPIAFSPDSRRLAIQAPGGLFVVDCQSGKSRRLTPKGEYAEKVRWCSATRLGYVTCQSNDGSHGCHWGCARRFWVQDVSDASASRRLVLDCSDCFGEEEYSWSPDGASIVLMPTEHKRWRLVNVDDGSFTEFGTLRIDDKFSAMQRGMGVSWSSDGSQAICLSLQTVGREGWWVGRLDVASKRTTDLTAGFLCSPVVRYIVDDNGRVKYGLAGLDEDWQCDDSCLLFEYAGCLMHIDDFSLVAADRDFVHALPSGVKLKPWIRAVGRNRFLIASAEDGHLFKIGCDARTVEPFNVGRWNYIDDPSFKRFVHEPFSPNGKYFIHRCDDPHKAPNLDVFRIPDS